MRAFFYLFWVILLILAGCTGSNDEDTDFDTAFNEAKAKAVLRSLESEEVSPIEEYVSAETYIQHNPEYPDGRQALLDALQSGRMAGTSVTIWRIFTDNDLVVAHTDYVLGGVPTVGFDVFRFEDGLIVEHWDNLQPKMEPTASGRSMISGTRGFADDNKTADNKTLVENFVIKVLINKRLDILANYFDEDTYIQHSPNVADGVENFRQYLEENADTLSYTILHKVIGEGNYVLTLSEGEVSGEATAFYDLFRLYEDKIVEHWDVVATIPPADQWANSNGKF